MESQLFGAIGICVLQLILIWTTISQRKKMEKIADNLEVKIKVEVDETKLEKHIDKLISQFQQTTDDNQAQDTFINHTAAEVIKQITDAMEVISLDKSKNVKIIVSNDNINQERFIVKLSYRTV